MKQSIILWTAAIVLTFLAGYAHRIKSPDYPVNGTINMVSGEASFSFDKIYRSQKSYKVWLADNCENLQGTLNWRNVTDTVWHNEKMKSDSGIIFAEYLAHEPKSKVEYRAELTDKDKIFMIPANGAVTMQFEGRVPSKFQCFIL